MCFFYHFFKIKLFFENEKESFFYKDFSRVKRLCVRSGQVSDHCLVRAPVNWLIHHCHKCQDTFSHLIGTTGQHKLMLIHAGMLHSK